MEILSQARTECSIAPQENERLMRLRPRFFENENRQRAQGVLSYPDIRTVMFACTERTCSARCTATGSTRRTA